MANLMVVLRCRRGQGSRVSMQGRSSFGYLVSSYIAIWINTIAELSLPLHRISPYYHHSLWRKALVPLPGCLLDYLDCYILYSMRKCDGLKELSRCRDYRAFPGVRKSLDSNYFDWLRLCSGRVSEFVGSHIVIRHGVGIRGSALQRPCCEEQLTDRKSLRVR